MLFSLNWWSTTWPRDMWHVTRDMRSICIWDTRGQGGRSSSSPPPCAPWFSLSENHKFVFEKIMKHLMFDLVGCNISYAEVGIGEVGAQLEKKINVNINFSTWDMTSFPPSWAASWVAWWACSRGPGGCYSRSCPYTPPLQHQLLSSPEGPMVM